MNISPDLLAVFGKGSNWTTEFFVQQLLAAGVPFDVVGIETHYGEGDAWTEGDIATRYNRLITLSKLGKPIYAFEDGLESHIDPNSIKLDYWAPWHGEPTEAKQAEYMVAETLVYLGNPSVVGVRWYQLQDEPWDAPQHRYQGVLIYPNGSKKESFYALQNLWGNLTTHANIQSEDGVATFTGLPGDYSISAQGYLPVKVTVTEAASTMTFKITFQSIYTTSTTLQTISISASGLVQSSAIRSEQGVLSGQYVPAVTVAFIAAVVVVSLVFIFTRRNRSTKLACNYRKYTRVFDLR
jgi:hypothetical protein